MMVWSTLANILETASFLKRPRKTLSPKIAEAIFYATYWSLQTDLVNDVRVIVCSGSRRTLLC